MNKKSSRSVGRFPRRWSAAFDAATSRAMLLVSCGVLCGCTVGPKYRPPVTQAPAAYKEAPQKSAADNGLWQVAQPQDAALRGNWWEIFQEPELNALEEQLNINNQNIKRYFENFMQARAIVRQARAQYFPSFGTSPSYTRQRSSANLQNSTTANVGRQSKLYSVPFDISWEPDLWGKIRNQVHAAEYSAQVSAADLENERLTEQTALAQYFFEIRGQDALIALYKETVAADRQSLELTQAQYETGVGDKIAVIEARNTLERAQSAETNLGILRAQYEHAIAVLVGKPAPEFSIPDRALTAAPPPIPVGLPSQLLQRRPDIAAAERALAAANAQIGVADAAYYPTLTLSAAGGFQSSLARHLFDWPSRFWSVGPSVSETIYDGGLRRATVNEYIAIYNADLAGYRQTVLTAFQQVEDSLTNVQILSEQIAQQQRVVVSSQQALQLQTARYQTGIDPYLNVVTLQLTLLNDQQTLTNLKISQMTGAVQLIEAVGGGWDVSQLPAASQVSAKPAAAETRMQQ